MKSYEIVQQILQIILLMEVVYAVVLYSFHLRCIYVHDGSRQKGSTLFPIGCGMKNWVFFYARSIIFVTVIACQTLFAWGLRSERPELMWPWVTLQIIIFSYAFVRLGFVSRCPFNEFMVTLHWIFVGSVGCFLNYWVYIEYKEYNDFLVKEKDSMYKGSTTYERQTASFRD